MKVGDKVTIIDSPGSRLKIIEINQIESTAKLEVLKYFRYNLHAFSITNINDGSNFNWPHWKKGDTFDWTSMHLLSKINKRRKLGDKK
jgi:hypothetical protein